MDDDEEVMFNDFGCPTRVLKARRPENTAGGRAWSATVCRLLAKYVVRVPDAVNGHTLPRGALVLG